MITPDNFKADPLGWAGNQCGHMFIFAAIAFNSSVFWVFFFGEYPVKLYLFGAITLIYLAIELPQNGKVWDTVEDIIFVIGYGSAFYLFPFSEVNEGSFDLSIDTAKIVIPAIIVQAHIAMGMGIRLIQMRQQNEVG